MIEESSPLIGKHVGIWINTYLEIADKIKNFVKNIPYLSIYEKFNISQSDIKITINIPLNFVKEPDKLSKESDVLRINNSMINSIDIYIYYDLEQQKTILYMNSSDTEKNFLKNFMSLKNELLKIPNIIVD